MLDRFGDGDLGVEGRRIAEAWSRLVAGDVEAAHAHLAGVTLETWEARRLHVEVLQVLGRHGEARREL